MACDGGAPPAYAREPRLRGRPVRVPPALLAEAREESARSRLLPARASLMPLAQRSSGTCSACSRARGAARSAATTPTPPSDLEALQIPDCAFYSILVLALLSRTITNVTLAAVPITYSPGIPRTIILHAYPRRPPWFPPSRIATNN